MTVGRGKWIIASAAPFLVFLVVFFYAPFAYVVVYSFKTGSGAGLSNYIALLHGTYLRVLAASLKLALSTTLITLLLAYPAAVYAGLMAGVRERYIVLVGFMIPFWIDFLLRAIALKNILYILGVRPGFTATLMGMVYDYLPYMFLPIYASVSNVPRNAVDAARSLGASAGRIFKSIILPLTMPGIAVGIMLVGLMSLSDYVIPSLLGNVDTYTFGTILYYMFLESDQWGLGSALTVLLVASTMAAGYYTVKKLGKEALEGWES
ncbi:MAG: ABC transporter permease [Desulfurococcales archaeon]|nr:ABC transporter permease [Desulfurococcales archaeon]